MQVVLPALRHTSRSWSATHRGGGIALSIPGNRVRLRLHEVSWNRGTGLEMATGAVDEDNLLQERRPLTLPA